MSQSRARHASTEPLIARALRPVALVALGAGLASPAAGQIGKRLSNPLPQTIVGEVGPDYIFSASGDTVFYTSEERGSGRSDVYAAPSDGSGTGRLLSPGTAAFSSGGRLQLSPDGTRILYLYSEGSTGLGRWQLFSAASDGSGVPAELTPPTIPITLQETFSPDGNWVVYRAGGGSSPQVGVYAVPSDGSSSPIPLSTVSPSHQAPTVFRIDPTGASVVYRADHETSGIYELYRAPINGSSAPVRISQPLSGSSDVDRFEIDPAGQFVVYTLRTPATGLNLYSVPLNAGSPPQQLSTSTQNLHFVGEFEITRDGRGVLFTANLSGQAEDLWGVSINGAGPPVRLSDAATVGSTVWTFALTPDGSRVVYDVDAFSAQSNLVYSRLLTAGAASVRLTPANGTGSHATGDPFVISPDSSSVLWRGVDNGDLTLFGARLDGSIARRLSPASTPNGFLDEFAFAPGAGTVVFRTAAALTGPGFVYSNTIPGTSAATLLSGTDEAYDAAVNPPGDLVLYRSALEDGFNLLSRNVSGPGPTVTINGSLPQAADGDLDAQLVSPNERWVVYLGEQETSGVTDLYSVPRQGGLARKLTPSLPADYDVGAFNISPDSRTVVFTIRRNNIVEAYSIPIDGSAPAIQLSGPFPSFAGVGGAFSQVGDLSGLIVSEDSQTLTYLARPTSGGRQNLYTAPLDGSTPQSNRTQSLAGTRSVEPFWQLSPDGQFAVFRQRTSGTGHILYSVPLQGPATVRRLSGAEAALRRLTFSRDGLRVIYLGARLTLGTADLFTRNVDGSGSITQLSSIPAMQFDVEDFATNEVNDLVAYSTYDSGVSNLYSVPSDGSLPPQLLNVGGPALRGVNTLESSFTADATRLVFIGSPTAGVLRLYSVPLSGAPGIQLSPNQSNFVLNYEVSRSNDRVIFYMSGSQSSDLELLSVRADGSGPLVSLLGPLTGVSSNARDAKLSENGEQVFYVLPNQTGQPALWRRDVDGASPPVAMAAPGSIGPERGAWSVTSNGWSAVYLAQTGAGSGIELFSSRFTVAGDRRR